MITAKYLAELDRILQDEAQKKQVLCLIEQIQQDWKTQIHANQRAGIAAAKASGVRLGRPPMECPPNFAEIYFAQRDGRLTISAAAEMIGVTVKTYHRLCERYEAAKAAEKQSA